MTTRRVEWVETESFSPLLRLSSQEFPISPVDAVYGKESHISSKAKDPHPLAGSGLISFCGLLKDIFSFLLFSFSVIPRYIFRGKMLRRNPFSEFCGEDKFLCFMMLSNIKLNIFDAQTPNLVRSQIAGWDLCRLQGREQISIIKL